MLIGDFQQSHGCITVVARKQQRHNELCPGEPSLLGKRIRELRRAAGLSQPELARRASISASYISQLETAGRRNCTMEVVRGLARALEYPVVDLLREAGVIPDDDVSEERRRLIDQLVRAAEFLPERVLQSELERMEIQAEHYRRERLERGSEPAREPADL